MTYLAVEVKKLLKYRCDDTNNVWATHGLAGILGNVLTGVFAQKSIAEMAGVNGRDSNSSGAIEGNV